MSVGGPVTSEHRRTSIPIYIARNLGLAIVYFGAAKLRLLASGLPFGLELIWIPSGIALAVVRARGFAMLPGVIIGSFFANYSPGVSLWTPLATALGNPLETVAAVLLLRRFNINPSMESTRDVFWFGIPVVLISSTVAALFGSLSYLLEAHVSWREFLQSFPYWLVGDTMGLLFVGPPLLALVDQPRDLRRGVIPWTVLTMALGLLVFGLGGIRIVFAPILIMPILVFVTFRFDPPEVSWVNLALVLGASAGLRIRLSLTNAPQEVWAPWAVVAILFVSFFTTQTIAATLAERNKTRRSLAESESRYRELIEGADVLVTTINAEGKIVYANAKSKDVWGLEPEECLGWPALEFTHPDDRDATAKEFARFSREMVRKTNFENRQVHTDGSIRFLLWTIHVVHDAQGAFVYANAFARDITSIKNAEAALLDHERTLEQEVEEKTAELRRAQEVLIDAQKMAKMGSMTTWVDPKTGVYDRVEMTPGVYDILDIPYEPGPQPAGIYRSYVHPDDLDDVENAIQRSLTTDEHVYNTHRIITAEGELKHIHGVMLHIRNPADELVMISIIQDVTQRVKLEEDLRTLATTDPLTAIGNRRWFFERFEDEIKRCRRLGHPFGLLMIDIDLFKGINDSFGHDGGDAVLVDLVRTVKQSLREIDGFARLGGEEFAVLLVETAEDQIRATAERIRAAVETRELKYEGKEMRYTVSIGGASLRDDSDTLKDLMKRADQFLYRAKSAGRNRVEAG